MKATKSLALSPQTDSLQIYSSNRRGVRTKAIRVTAIALDYPGQWRRITKAIADAGGNFISFASLRQKMEIPLLSHSGGTEMKLEEVKKALMKVVVKFVDVREC